MTSEASMPARAEVHAGAGRGKWAFGLLWDDRPVSAVGQADLPGINRFVNGVTADLDAVTAGLSLPFSSGPVEGTVNRIKMLKRQMYGRAGFDLLRKRVQLAS
jgi:Transposase